MSKDSVKQAVVLLETFNENFKPCESNSTLLPVANTRISDYLFEWLELSGIEEVIFFTSSGDAKQSKYFKQSHSFRFSTNYFVSKGCHSLGDVMRALDGHSVIRNSFVLIHGDVIGNVNFNSLFRKFEEIQTTDKGITMMMVYQNVGNDRCDVKNDAVIGTNCSGKLVYYQNTTEDQKIDIPIDTLLEHNVINIRDDLLNTSVAVCSAAVPALYSDNFDFQTQEDLIKEILTNADVLTNTLYCHALQGTEYLIRVENWPAYQRVTRDIIRRWIYPIVPDLIEKYNCRRNYIYLANRATISKGCLLDSDTIIGNYSILEDNVHVSQSVIGKHCKIGKNSVIKSSYIFDDVTISENCFVSGSVISNNCSIGKNCKIEMGSVIGSNIILHENAEVKSTNLVSANSVSNQHRLMRFNDNCFIYKRDKTSISESDDGGDVDTAAGLLYEEIRNFSISDSEESEENSSGRNSPVLDDVQIFYNEVFDSLAIGYQDKLKCEDMIVEINSSRYAYNITVNEVNYNVVKAILSIAAKEECSDKDAALLQFTLKKLVFFLPMLRNYIKNVEAQRDCLNAIAEVATYNSNLQNILVKIIHYLYDKDIVSEDIIIGWYGSSKSDFVKKIMNPFIKWLAEADEESEEESD